MTRYLPLIARFIGVDADAHRLDVAARHSSKAHMLAHSAKFEDHWALDAVRRVGRLNEHQMSSFAPISHVSVDGRHAALRLTDAARLHRRTMAGDNRHRAASRDRSK
jgi:hypothetical protein